jgi:nucleoid DNA-binding protein
MNIEMNNDKLVNVFTKKSGLNEPQASTILTAVIQYVGKQLAGNSNTGGIENIMSVLSNLRGLNADHPLVKQVLEDTDIKDSHQVTQYTQQAVDLIKQEADTNPKEVESVFDSFLGDMGDSVTKVTKTGLFQKLGRLFYK